MRIKFLIPALVVGLAACSSAAESQAPASDAPASDAPSADALVVSVADFLIDPSDLEVSGSAITIDVTNDGPTPHNLSIRDADGEVLLATSDLSVGDMETITGELEPGDYTIFCSLGGHESLGMSGTLTVSAS
ncbi:MAG: cupredoxin domain-containing protein [Candidatus Limnocylindria bacterium]